MTRCLMEQEKLKRTMVRCFVVRLLDKNSPKSSLHFDYTMNIEWVILQHIF